MKTFNEKQVVHFLLTQMTYLLLERSPVRDGLKKAAERQLGDLRSKLAKEEYAPILAMRDVLAELAVKLARCESVVALEQTLEYLKALNRGEVMVAIEDDEGAVTGYVKNQ